MRDPVGGIDFLERLLTQRLDADEKLFYRPEQNRGLGAPAMGVAMDVILPPEQRSPCGQDDDDLFVPVEDIFPHQRGNATLLGEFSVIIDG